MLIAWEFVGVKNSGLATLLYATILFLGAIFRSDRPYPVTTRPSRQIHSDYAVGEDELGFTYTFSITNLGSKPLNNPRIDYCIVDKAFSKKRGWTAIQPPDDGSSSAIDPGETAGPFEIKHSGITKDEYEDYHVAVRALPRDGNWALGCLWLVSVGNEAKDSSQ